MSDKITTLHLKNDPSTNVYPNVKIENIPLDESVTRDGENLVKTKTIYDFAHLNFLSLDGGTMDGIITINDIGIPEKTILGDGVEVVEVSNPANPTTHYGSGYIRQDDDEDSSIKYHYNFPKKSGTFALEEELEELKSLVYSLHSLTYNSYEFSYLTSSIIPDEVDGRKVVGGSYAIMDWVGGNSVVTDDEIKSTIVSKIESWGYNLFDGEFELGDLSGGTLSTNCHSKNFIKVVGGKNYTLENGTNISMIVGSNGWYLWEYDENFNVINRTNRYGNLATQNYRQEYTLLNNTKYIKFYLYTEKGNFTNNFPNTFSFHRTGSRTGYAPYVGKLGEINIPNAPLKLDSVNDIHNTLTFEKQADGTYNAILTRKFGIVDLGTLDWTLMGTSKFQTQLGSEAKGVSSNSEKANILCDKYQIGSWSQVYANENKVLGMNISRYLAVTDTDYTDVASFKSAMSGVNLLYELATPTSEVIATGLTFDKASFPIEKGGTIKAIYEEVPPTISVNFMTKGE